MFLGGFGQLARVPIANVIVMHLNLRCGLEREPQLQNLVTSHIKTYAGHYFP